MKEKPTSTSTTPPTASTPTTPPTPAEHHVNGNINNEQEIPMREKMTATTQPTPLTTSTPTTTAPPTTPPLTPWTPTPPPPTTETDIDLARIRLPQDFTGQVAVRKLTTTIPIRKPKPNDFIRVHPAIEPMRVWTLEDEQETFIVTGDVAVTVPNDVVAMELVLTITRQGNILLWPLRILEKDGRINNWHTSRREAAARAVNAWVRVSSNMHLGAYEVYEALGVIPDPVWPALSMDEIVRIAVKGRVIDSLDHPVLRKLRGEI